MEKTEIKRRFLWQTKINIIIYICCYIVKVFVTFKISNPFQWLIDMPIYSYDLRAGILTGFIFYICFCQHFVWAVKNNTW